MVSVVLRENTSKEIPRFCWADTWCIDQSDPDDKFRQIPLMGDIYRDAQSVIITVRHEFSFSQADWDAAISGCREIIEVQRLPAEEYSTSERRMGCLTIPSVKALFQCYAMMTGLASLPWANRIWTAQEYILSKPEIWIGMNFQSVRVSVADMTTIFAVRWSRRDILRMFEDYIGVPQDFSAAEEEAVENLDLMNRIRENKVHPVKTMLLAGARKCTVLEDEIYGLMGASGVVFEPRKGESLETAWIRWWEASLRNKNLFYALLPVLEPDNEQVATQSWNCVMPPTAQRCELGAKTHTHKAESWGEVHVHDGTLSVPGKRPAKFTSTGTSAMMKFQLTSRG
jgi:hypothetical protein